MSPVTRFIATALVAVRIAGVPAPVMATVGPLAAALRPPAVQVQRVEPPPTDDQTARQQVAAFGRGEKIQVKLNSGRSLRGSIAAIANEDFTLLTGGRAMTIRYEELAVIGPARMPRWGKVVLIAGVVGGAVLLKWAEWALGRAN